MLRTALRPRWLGALALALVLASAFAGLGSWQLDRAQRDDGPAAAPAPVPITSVAAPQRSLDGDAVAGPVVAEGRWETGDAVLVVDQRVGDARGTWVVAPLVTDDGARLAVVLGWEPDAASSGASGSAAAVAADVLAALPTGPVEVTGRLQVSQEPSGAQGDLAPDELRSLSAADLANRWESAVWSGYLLAAEAPSGLEVVPAPAAEQGLHLLNVSYALQWWVFAAFAVFLWWRVVRDVHQRETGDVGVPAEGAGAAGETGPSAEPTPTAPVEEHA